VNTTNFYYSSRPTVVVLEKVGVTVFIGGVFVSITDVKRFTRWYGDASRHVTSRHAGRVANNAFLWLLSRHLPPHLCDTLTNECVSADEGTNVRTYEQTKEANEEW